MYKQLRPLSAQLWWTVQTQKGVANATNWIMQFCRLTRLSTGLSVKLMRQLYISVAIPKMMYALDIWTPLQPSHLATEEVRDRWASCDKW